MMRWYGAAIGIMMMVGCGQRMEREVVSGLCTPVTMPPAGMVAVVVSGPQGHAREMHVDQRAWFRAQGMVAPIAHHQQPHAGALMLQIAQEVEDLNSRLIGAEMTTADLDEALSRTKRVRALLERLQLVTEQSGQLGFNPSVVYHEHALKEL